MKEFMDYYFGDTYFDRLLFATYVLGYKDSKHRPKFSVFKMALNDILKGVARGL
jgi:hypothetical protein